MTTKIYRTWQERLDTGRLTKSQIQAFGRRVTPMAEDVPIPGGAKTALRSDEAYALRERIRRNPVLLTVEHTDQGLSWLDRHGAKELHDDRVADIVEHFSRFTWSGQVLYGPNNYPTPVWTVHLTDGRIFRYWYASGWRESMGSSGELWQIYDPATVPTIIDKARVTDVTTTAARRVVDSMHREEFADEILRGEHDERETSDDI